MQTVRFLIATPCIFIGWVLYSVADFILDEDDADAIERFLKGDP